LQKILILYNHHVITITDKNMTTDNAIDDLRYDGKANLQPALAALYGCSAKNQEKLADLIKQAREGLGIIAELDSRRRAKRITDQPTKLAVWQWHYASLYPTSAAAMAERTAQRIHAPYLIDDVVRIAFYTGNKGERIRQVIALDGFYVNALMLSAGIKKKRRTPMDTKGGG
jgi:hypothetical protein